MVDVKISKNTLELEGKKYFRRNASSMAIGAVGEKEAHFLGAATLAVGMPRRLLNLG